MTYRQESEKDEEHALICLSAPKQMKYSQEHETDEEREKNPFDARPTYFSYVTSGKNYDSILVYSSYKSTQAA